MMPVTKPYLPSKVKCQRFVADKCQWLSNNRSLVNEFELRLKFYLNLNHIKFLFVISLLFYTSTSYSQTNQQITFENISDGLSQKEINFIENNLKKKAITPNNYSSNNVHRIAELIYENKIYLNSTWKPVILDGPIDWTINPYHDNSWLLNFHSLIMVPHLIQGYEISNNKKFVYKAISIFEAWINYFPIDKKVDYKKFRYVWAEHSVSNRLEYMLYLAVTLKKIKYNNKDIIELLYKSIYEHAAWLYDSKNYVEYNHGIIMDMALLKTSLVCPFLDQSENWYNKSLKRIIERYLRDVSSDGVHLENSPAYHMVAAKWLNDIISLLKDYKRTVPSVLQKRLDLMKNYTLFLIKPNFQLPLIGDTKDGSVLLPSRFEKSKHIKYLKSEGKKGKAPKEVSKVFEGADVAIFRDSWHKKNSFDKSSYLYFNAGFHSRVHKHADDLSFTFYTLGQDIFIDPGLYSYTPSPKREYIRSSLAHNGITINNTSYPMYNFNIGNTTLEDYHLKEEYDYVKGKSATYKDVIIAREMIYLKPNVIIIYDSIQNVSSKNKTLTVQQIFNLTDSAEITYKSKQLVKAKIGNLTVEIIQVEQVDSLNHFYGSIEPLRGFMSRNFNEIIKHPQIEFVKNGNNLSFTTYIILNSKDYINPISKLELSSNKNGERIISYTKNNIHKIINLDENKIIESSDKN